MKFLKRDEVSEMTSLPISTIRQLVRSGHFPKPIKISPGRIAWSQAAIEKWQQDCIDNCDGDVQCP
jgi:prophage regulatory protein